jgi:hypothetical protein
MKESLSCFMMQTGGKYMNISGISGNISQAPQQGAGKAMDAQSRNIQKQITEAQKKLQELSVRGDLSQEEKMKKRQEIQKQIGDLNMQLRQHQTEVKRQEQEEKKAAESAAGKQNGGGQDTGFSAAGMQAVLSADTTMKQAQVQRGAAAKLEGRANVLEAEIQQDGRTGGNTERKEAELAEVRERAKTAGESGMNTLKEAGRKAEGAGNTEPEGRTNKAEGKAGKAEEEAGGRKTEGEKTGQTDNNGEEAGDKEQKEPGMYVDVRL